MLKRLNWPILLIIFLLLPNIVAAADPIRVIVLPFTVLSPEPRPELSREITRVVEQELEKEGAAAVQSDPTIPMPVLSSGAMGAVDAIKTFGAKNRVDAVVWGSTTWIGEGFSLDVNLVETYGRKSPFTFFQQGRGAENLPAMVKKVTGELALQLFRRQKVTDVRVEGNDRIEADAIKRQIATRSGEAFLASRLSKDIKAIFAMDYFDDVRVEAEDQVDGKLVVFTVKEKPTIRKIRLAGNTVLKDEEINDEILDIKTGSILNIARLQRNVERIKDSYREKNYHNVEVSYRIEPLENNQTDLEFVIEEGEKLLIKSIQFVGNSQFDEDELKDLMKTSEKGFFSWITSSGDLNREDLRQDSTRIAAYYHNNGFIQARVSDPQIDFKPEWVEITIKIEEGPQFAVGAVTIEGQDLGASEAELLQKVKITAEENYNREILRNDVLALTDYYSDLGFAYAQVSPKVKRDYDQRKVDIAYVIDKGKPVVFERIVISGNTRTRDKVIRRQLKVYEQESYSGVRLKKGVQRLHRLEYFEDIKVNTEKGSRDDTMVLNIDVTEKSTGALSFGGGYSSVEDLFFMAQISQRNFLGRGQILQLKGQIGGTTNKFDLSFTEPWLFDIPLSAGFDVYKWDRDYDDYTKDSVGAGMRLGYPIIDHLRFTMGYMYDIADITDITDQASDSVREMAGENITSSVQAELRWDSRDRIFNPSRGSIHKLIIEYAGLGGDVGFAKYQAETGWYLPIVWELVGFVRGKGGYVEQTENKKLPDWEKFYLGGINSLRGFDWRDISPTEVNSKGIETEVGGEKFVQMNLELIFPIYKKAGLMGVLFYDTGNVWRESEDIEFNDLRESAGFGFRWYSPVGPIRVEYGHILDRQEDEDTGRWEFTMGASF